MQALDDRIILAALKFHQGNITRTAQYLNLSRRALSYRLKKAGQE